MRKIILTLGVVASFGLMVFVSCKKESLTRNSTSVSTSTSQDNNSKNSARQGDNREVNLNSIEVTGITELPSIAAALNSNHINGFDSGHKTSIDNSQWDVYELTKTISINEKSTLLYMTNTNKKIVMPFLVKTSMENGVVTGYSVRGLLSGKDFGTIFINPKTGGTEKPTCPESTDNFNSCFHCAMNELTDDLLGTIACTVMPLSCVIASAGACAIFGNMAFVSVGDNGRNVINHNDIEAFVNASIDSGVFTTSNQENGAYILN